MLLWYCRKFEKEIRDDFFQTVDPICQQSEDSSFTSYLFFLIQILLNSFEISLIKDLLATTYCPPSK